MAAARWLALRRNCPGRVLGTLGSTARGEHGASYDGPSYRGGQEPERQWWQPVPQGQVRAVVDIEGGRHRPVTDAHPGGLGGVPRPVAFPVEKALGGGGEPDGADDWKA